MLTGVNVEAICLIRTGQALGRSQGICGNIHGASWDIATDGAFNDIAQDRDAPKGHQEQKMQGEARPQLSLNKIAPYLGLLLIGTVALLFVFGPDQFMLKPASPSTVVGALPTSQFVLVKQGSPLALVLGAFLTALITVSLFELLKLTLQHLLWMTSKRKKLNTFFGDGSVENSGAAEVIAQSDRLNVVLADLVDSDAKLQDMPHSRLYKARSWINRFDADGGRQVIKLFRDEGLAAPTLKPVDRGRVGKPESIPFKVLLGLGFTDEAKKLIDGRFESWLRIVVTGKGDAISLRRSLLPGDWESRLDGTPDPTDAAFVTLLAKNWNLDDWLSGSKFVRDYAVILRHTADAGGGSKSCTYFWLAGFTERGTAAAGRYFAENWEDLYQRLVKPKEETRIWQGASARSMKRGRGDFMIVIEGPSHDKDLSAGPWSQVSGFAITPELLLEKQINSSWAQRTSFR